MPIFERHVFDAGEPSRRGYARVSTVGQDLSRQLRALEGARCSVVYSEAVSGARARRPGLEALRADLRRGDTVVVDGLDRLARGAAELLTLCDELLRTGVSVEALAQGLNTAGHGKLLLPFVAAIAECERQLIRERTLAGLEAARARGAQVGRPRVRTAERAQAAQALHDAGRSVRDIAQALGVSPTSVRRMLRAERRAEARQSAALEETP